MAQLHITSANEVLFKKGKWKIMNQTNPMTGRVRCTITDGWKLEQPIIYSDRTVAYDHPEIIPKHIREKVKILAKRGVCK